MLTTSMCPASSVVFLPMDLTSYCGALYYIPSNAAMAPATPQYCYAIPTATAAASVTYVETPQLLRTAVVAPAPSFHADAPAKNSGDRAHRVFASLGGTCRYLPLPKATPRAGKEPAAAPSGTDLYVAQCAQYATTDMIRHVITELCGVSPQSVHKAPMNSFFVTMATAADAQRAVDCLHHRVVFDNEGVWHDVVSRGSPTTQGPLHHWETVTRTEIHVPHLPRRRMIVAIRRNTIPAAQ